MSYDTENKRAVKHINMFLENKERIAKKKAIVAQPNAIHLILSQHMNNNNPGTTIEMFHAESDINDIWRDLDINDSLEEELLLEEDQEDYPSKFVEKYEESIIHMNQDE